MSEISNKLKDGKKLAKTPDVQKLLSLLPRMLNPNVTGSKWLADITLKPMFA